MMKTLLALFFALSIIGSAQAQVGLTGYPPNGQLPGTATNDDAGAGKVGEYISATIAQGSAISLSNTAWTALANVSLTAGDWEVTCNPYFQPAATTNVTLFASGIGTAANASPGIVAGTFGETQYASGGVVFGSTGDLSREAGPYRMSLAATTTVYCNVLASFSVSTMAAWGYIRARRVR